MDERPSVPRWVGEGEAGNRSLPPRRPGAAGGRPGMPEPAGFIWIPPGSKLGALHTHSSVGCQVRDVCDKNVSFIHHCSSPGCELRASYTRGACLLKEELNLALLITKQVRFYIDFLFFLFFLNERYHNDPFPPSELLHILFLWPGMPFPLLFAKSAPPHSSLA